MAAQEKWHPLRTAKWLANPRVQVWFNGSMTVLWFVMLPVTFMFQTTFQKVVWVSFISAWALFATHLGAWIAALVNVKAERIDDRTKEEAHLAAMEETEARLLIMLQDVRNETLKTMADQHDEMLQILRIVGGKE